MSESIEAVVAPIVTSLDLELVDVEVRPGNVKISLDREGGVDLSEIGAATAAISRALDHDDVVPGGRYELEVSSPGLERRLRRPEHFARFVGAEISVRTRPGVGGDRRFDALLVSADETGIVVTTATPPATRRLEYPELEKVHTIFDWKAALAGTSAPSQRAERRGNRTPATAPARAERPSCRPDDANREMTETG